MAIVVGLIGALVVLWFAFRTATSPSAPTTKNSEYRPPTPSNLSLASKLTGDLNVVGKFS